jgi:hypothetical protein
MFSLCVLPAMDLVLARFELQMQLILQELPALQVTLPTSNNKKYSEF